jgi:FkbM family methyltransferase
MAGPFRLIGRGVRRLVLPLVGFWHLRQMLADVLDRLDALETGMRAIAARQEDDTAAAQAARDTALLERRILETGGELGRKMDMANDKLDRSEPLLGALQERPAPPPLARIEAAVAREIDRLDGYLLHHATVLRDSIEHVGTTLDDQLTAARRENRQERPYVGAGMSMVVPTGGFDVVVPTVETGLLMLILRGAFETLETDVRAALATVVKPGATVVDAGANVGLHALPIAAAIGPEGRLFCFEPVPELADGLARSMRINGFADRALVRCAALAEAPGESVLNRAAHGAMSSLSTLPASEGSREIPVELVTLDGVFAPGARVDVVKMDIEGAEPRAWRGMQRVLADNPRIAIVMEWSASHFRRAGEDAAAFLAEIRAAGFAVQEIGGAADGGDIAPREGANLLLTRGM